MLCGYVGLRIIVRQTREPSLTGTLIMSSLLPVAERMLSIIKLSVVRYVKSKSARGDSKNFPDTRPGDSGTF